jgi:hypothetical protein
MTLERSNKVTNVERDKFTKLILDLLQLLTLEEIPYAILRIIKQVTWQEGIINIERNGRIFCIMSAIHLLCDRPFNLLDKLLTLSICNKMVENTKMNHHF